jgi:hypothetical protein
MPLTRWSPPGCASVVAAAHPDQDLFRIGEERKNSRWRLSDLNFASNRSGSFLLAITRN